MRVFLDVGAHVGETVEAVLDPKYRFERIVCFEPVARCRAAIRRFDDPRIEVMPFGLWNQTCERELFGAGTLAGSLFADMPGADAQPPEVCRFLRARDWFRENIAADDAVFMKLNCEGSECDIVEDLLDSGDLARLATLMVDFDAGRIPSQRHREAEVRRRLADADLTNCHYANEVMIGSTHIARIQNWLHGAGADRCPATTKIRQAIYLLGAPAQVRKAVLGGRYGRLSRAFSRLAASR